MTPLEKCDKILIGMSEEMDNINQQRRYLFQKHTILTDLRPHLQRIEQLTEIITEVEEKEKDSTDRDTRAKLDELYRDSYNLREDCLRSARDIEKKYFRDPKPEQIDYDSLIDPLCRKTIKLLREKFGVETSFCCQGRSVEDIEHHSNCGYIAAHKTQRDIFYLDGILGNVFRKYSSQKRKVRRLEFRNEIAIYLPRKLFTIKELKKIWKEVEEYLENLPTDEYETKKSLIPKYD